MLRILFFGDLFGKPSRQAMQIALPKLNKKYKPDFVVANIENMAHGKGVTPTGIQELEKAGEFHAYTTGNHFLSNEKVLEVVKDDSVPLIRPFNYSPDTPGRGYRLVESGTKRLLVTNFMGRVFMKQAPLLTNPFVDAERVLADYTIDKNEKGKEIVDAILVDFHAEATAEKRNFGFLLDGRVSAVVGTHTHVQTSDSQVLEKGTAYISDVGMCGPTDSSLGLNKDDILEEMITGERGKRDVSDVPRVEIGAVVIDVEETGLASNIERVFDIIEI